MDRKEYRKLLGDKRWKQRRLEILELNGNKCGVCGTTTNLEVHHKAYKEKAPWDYEDDELEVKCKDCHKKHHREHGKTIIQKYAIMGHDITTISDNGEEIKGRVRGSYVSSHGVIDYALDDYKSETEGSLTFNISDLAVSISEFTEFQNSGNIKIEAKSLIGDALITMYITGYFKTLSKSELRNVSLKSKIEIEEQRKAEYKIALAKALERDKIKQEQRKKSYEKRMATIARNKALKEQNNN